MTNNAARIRLMSGRTFPRNADFTLCIRDTCSVYQGGAERYDSFSDFRERTGTGTRRPEMEGQGTPYPAYVREEPTLSKNLLCQ